MRNSEYCIGKKQEFEELMQSGKIIIDKSEVKEEEEVESIGYEIPNYDDYDDWPTN